MGSLLQRVETVFKELVDQGREQNRLLAEILTEIRNYRKPQGGEESGVAGATNVIAPPAVAAAAAAPAPKDSSTSSLSSSSDVKRKGEKLFKDEGEKDRTVLPVPRKASDSDEGFEVENE